MWDRHEQKTYRHKLIDWSKPAPVIPEKTSSLTRYEAHALNKGMAMNGLTKRWILIDDV